MLTEFISENDEDLSIQRGYEELMILPGSHPYESF